MKRFTFSLDRVLEWRRAQARREEIKLERLYAERGAIDASQAALRDQRQQAEAELRARREIPGQDITGQDLGALSAFHRHVTAESGRIAQARLGCERQIALQTPILTGQRRNVKLLEKLKQQRMTAWSSDLDREIGQQAEESHLAKWNRENKNM